MNDFRLALEAFLAGRSDVQTLEGKLRDSLQKQPHLAAAHSAIIEAMSRSGKMPVQVRDSLHQIVKSASQAPAPPPPAAPPAESSDKTQFRMPARPKPPAPPAPPPAESADKTQFRMPKPGPPRAGSPAPTPSPPPPTAPPVPPVARTPPTPPAPPLAPPTPPATPPPGADKTQLRVKPLTTGPQSKPPAPPATPRPAGKSGSLSDLLGAPDAGDAPADPSVPPAPTPPPQVQTPEPASTTTGSSTGTGPVTGSTTGSSTGTGRRTGTGGSSGGSSWTNLGADANAAPLAPGDTIKDRFVLEDIIGKGGMGIVFKARDLRWEEAQDRNPYVAVKVLNEDFKRHPESLKALQRESRKAQNLAHPNVVTVYQFDRDGANVFMVMELLEGEPLDKLIKRNDAGGLPPKTALKYTAHMARALAYAHEQGIVHSDFKPANAYMTRDGTVKVFDFGISRAAKRSDKVQGSMTLFDPGTLGALTPAYASCEMIEGEEPDPRDDIYALACTFYELLTGKHPFNKQSAVVARDAKMVPAPVPALTRAQWKGLLKGLSFKREQRSATVMQFLNDISLKKQSPVRWIAIAASVVLVGVAIALFLPGYLEKRRINAIAADFARGDETAIPDALERMSKLTPEQRSALLATNSSARDGLLSYFENQISAATDESKQKYDYTRATTLLTQAQEIFTDSSRVATMKQTLDGRQSDLINRLSRRFDDTLSRGWLIDKQNPENASRVLSILAQVQPQHPLLTDKRLLIAYSEQADSALDRGNAELADELIAAGLKIAPQDAGLKDLGDRARVVKVSQQSVQRVRALRASIDTALGSSPALEAFDGKRAEIGELRAVAPDDQQLLRWQNQMQTQLDRRLVDLTDRRSFTDAEALLGKYAELASTAYVSDRRDALTSARKEHAENLARLGDSLQAAIRAGRLGPPAADNARAIYGYLERSGADAEQLAAAKDQISTAYARQAGELRSKGAFGDARKLVASGLEFGPSASVKSVLQDENKEIDDAEKLALAARDQQLRAQLAAQRTKEDNESKAQLATALKAPQQSIDSARSALQLAEKLQNRGVKDPLVVNARRDIQNQLLAGIRSTNEKSGPDAAIRFAEQASALMPESTVLSAQIVELRKAGAERQAQTRLAAIATIKAEIDALAKTPKLDDKWWRDSQAAFRRLAAYLPDTDPYVVNVKRSMATSYIAAARKSRDAKSLSEADRMIERAAQLSPNHPELEAERKLLADARVQQGRMAQETKLAADTDALKQRLRDQAKADDPDFLVTLKSLKQTLPANDAFLASEAPFVIAESYQRMATKAARRGSYDEAITLIDRGLENASGLRSLRDARARYVTIKDLSTAISSGNNLSVRDLRNGLAAIQTADQALYADVRKRFTTALEARIRAEQNRNPALASNYEAIGTQAQLIGQTAAAASKPATPVASTTTPARPTTPASGSTTTGSSSAPQSTTPAAQAGASESGGVAVTPASMTSTVAPKPCRAELAGRGTRSQAVCYDIAASGRGPDLVVLPAGGPFSSPVAVMRYELTNEDYNFYCTSTGRCKTVSAGPKLPIVSISAAEGERYANWLSEASGKVYRLPADAEWTYIATGIPDGADFNCTMEVGGQKVKGYALAEKNSGTPSKWGVYNIIGNAQEWARAPGGWVARGGAFSDNVTNCGVALGRAHSGSPDGKTGLRLVREF